MNYETFFFTLFVMWYFTNNPNLILILNNGFHVFSDFCKYYDNLISDKENEEEFKEEFKEVIKYEDKFLVEIRKMDKEFKFDEKEEELKLSKYLELWQSHKETYLDKIEEINDKLLEKEEKEVKEVKEEKEVKEVKEVDDDYCICENDIEISTILLIEQKRLLEIELNKLKAENETVEGEQVIMKKIEEQSRQFVIDQRLEKLKNCFVIEYTPLGNVLMIYDKERSSFKYYSDNSIPYRYLETVARKYVKQFNCRPIFIDIEDELKLAEEKWETERKETERKENERKEQNTTLKEAFQKEEKKNVFAKFKSYNKEAGNGKVNTAAPPKNSIPNKNLTDAQENHKLLIKEKTNRYTYEGKLVNFNFIKKVERKIVDKKYGMTFADFKRYTNKNIK